ncbi:Putative short-chain dehydrogenase/reductase SDR, NAD(P)-binding domain superfamily [Septoria linicola]|uniref:Short-chain dehydrogenase/reductase SDR, NAD(P)-binding domain superfamily n=1 Tax=Septoria linicola TaxID=215465 RepID=A0A9Q9AJF9_9PEZI|nr:Putative short-chain dehydrogenase/reductase SDR, NAD(P)-binding domain superfamily [Septoria linicola]
MAVQTDFKADRDIPDLNGKVILVTGGNAGIGASIVKALAAHSPSKLYICARTPSKAQTLIDTIRGQHPKANVEALELDLNSFESIKSCAARFNEQADRLDQLYLNAGISGTSPGFTKEGYENTFGVNHVGHTYFCQLIMPKLLQTQKQPGSDVRIVVTSSIGGHRLVPKTGLVDDLDTMKTLESSGMSSIVRYGHSKLANMLFAHKMAQLYPEITSTSFHPGTVKSEIWDKADGMKWLTWAVAPIVWLTGVDCDKGAEPGLWLGTAKKESIENGRYYEQGLFGKPKDRNPHAVDQRQADRLWEWTNKEIAAHGAPGWPQA